MRLCLLRVSATLFTFKSPLSNSAILADEVSSYRSLFVEALSSLVFLLNENSFSFSKPPAPLNVCVIREVFFCTVFGFCFVDIKQLAILASCHTFKYSMPAEPLGSFENLKLNSGGFFVSAFSA